MYFFTVNSRKISLNLKIICPCACGIQSVKKDKATLPNQSKSRSRKVKSQTYKTNKNINDAINDQYNRISKFDSFANILFT